MRKIILFFASVLIILPGSAQNPETIEIFYGNVSQAVITPGEPTYMIEPRGELSTGVHDDLYVKVIAFSDNINIFLIVSFDLVGLHDSLVHKIKKSIFNFSGIPSSHIMLSATHTHNAPITVNAMAPLPEEKMINKSARNKEWEEKMINITAETVKNVIKNMKEISLLRAKYHVELGANRRLSLSHRASMAPNPNGPALNETDVLFLMDKDNESGVVFSYAAHPVSVHSTSTEFSADYPGFAVKHIRSRFPGSTPVFLQGCGGNINSTLRGGYEAAKHDGDLLGEAVVRSREKGKTIAPSPIRAGLREFYLPFIHIDEEIAESMTKRIQESIETAKETSIEIDSGYAFMDLQNWIKRLSFYGENKDRYPGLPFQVQAFAFGKSLAIMAFPSEVFVDYALYIKEHSPFDQTIVLGYTNGCSSYIPSAEAFYLGGYEPGFAQIVYGQPYLSPEIDGIIKKESMSLLSELWQQYQ